MRFPFYTPYFLVVRTVCYLHYCITQFTVLVSHTNTLVTHICTSLAVETTNGGTGAFLHITQSVNYWQPARHIACILRQKCLTLSVLSTIYLDKK